MALFGLFKSKEEKELEVTLGKIQEHVFPNGNVDVKRDTARVNAITHGKIPPDRIEGFTVGCKTLLHIADDKNDDSRFVESFIRRSDGAINKDEAYEMYVYLGGEAAMMDNFSRAMGGSVDPSLQEGFASTLAIFSKGVYTDDLPTGYGEFGLVASNPIPTISVTGSNGYIARLRYGGRPVQAERGGSMGSDVTPGSIDFYSVSIDGKRIATIYICPYHKRNSRKAPKGFTLAAS